jgi:hypothetical protein
MASHGMNHRSEPQIEELPHESYPFITEWEHDNSPIPEVAATVPVTDDPTMNILTFRYLIISSLLTVFTSIMAQYFYFRYNTFVINGKIG